LGVADLGLMTDCAHNVDLIALIVDSVFHGFSVNGEALIVLSVDVIPALQGMVEMNRIDANQHITDDGEAGDDIAPVFISAAKTLPGFLAKAFGPVRYSQVSTHPTQGGSGGNG